MAAMCVSNRHSRYVNDLLSLCIFLTFLSPVELSRQLIVLKAGGRGGDGDGSSFNLTQIAARIENEKSGSFCFKAITGEVCSRRDISVRQRYIYSLTNGIPAFAVEIMNTCVTSCAIEDIHIKCGAFASAVEVNPKLFRRLTYSDCLVNDGQKLEAGRIVSFRYANSFIYPLSVASVKCDG